MQHATPPSPPRNQTKKATPEGKPHEILGRRTSAVELSRLTTQLRHLLCETERSCTRSSKKTNQRRRKPKRLAPPPTRSGSPAANPHRPAKKTPKQADRNGNPLPAKRSPTRKTSPQGANKSSTPHTEGRSTTNLHQRPSPEPAPTSPPPPLEKGRGTKTIDDESEVAVGKGSTRPNLDLLLYNPPAVEPGSPLKSVAGEAPEERGPAERRRKPGSPCLHCSKGKERIDSE